MALPQRRDPYEDERQRELELRRQRAVDAGGGWFMGWWWIWLLILVCAIWFAGWGWGGYGGWWWGPRGVRTASVGATQNLVSGNGVAVLDATDKLAYVGKPFEITGAHVQNVVNSNEMWITANNSVPMLVVLTGAGNSAANANIGNGSRVVVIGNVVKAPPADQAQKNWNLNNDDTQRLEQQGAYIEATQVEKIR